MKLLYVYDKYPDVYQSYLITLLEALRAKGRVRSLVYQSSVNADYSYRTYGIGDLFHRLCFKMALAKYNSRDIAIMRRADIVHLQHSYLFPKITTLLSFPSDRRPKIIITLRGGDTYIKPWVSKKWKAFYKEKGNEVDAFVVMSQHQKQYLTRWGIHASKIHVIPISFGPPFVAEGKYPNKNIIKIVSVFRLTWEKNIDGNLQVIKNIKDSGVSIQYDVYGDGPEKGQLLYLVDKYNLSDVFNFKGAVSNDIVKGNLPNYDFILQLSLSEALPTSILEAQAFGLPAVVSDSGGLPEAVVDNKTGFVVPTYNTKAASEKIIKLWGEPERYQAFSNEAIHYVQNNFNVHLETERLLRLYRSLLNPMN